MKNNKQTITVDSPLYETVSKKRFTIRIAIGLIAGGITGFLCALSSDLLKEQLSGVAKAILQKFPTLQIFVFPWVMLLVTIVCIAANEKLLKKSKRQIDSWDGEDDDHINVADSYLDKASMICSIGIISIQILFAIVTYNLMKNLHSTISVIMIFFAVIIYFANLIIAVNHQKRIFALIKRYAPEKQGSVYDKNLKDVWLASCDEAERYRLYEVGYKTYQSMNSVFSGFLVITSIIGMFIPIGFLCAFIVGLLWLIMTCCYSIEARKLESRK